MFIAEEAEMLKTLTLIFRGTSAQAVEDLADRNALLILDQHIRDAAAGLDRARRALAIAMAQDAAEVKRLDGVRSKIADLETRARAALAGNREDLAIEAAEALAGLEADRMSAEAAHASFLRESQKLRAMVANAERRLAELERGRRAARASEAVRRLRASGASAVGGDAGALRDAEAVLKRLRDRQLEDEAADDAFDALDGAFGPDLVAEKLETAGFGPRTKPTATSILERLKQTQFAEPNKPAN
jgi:phage shock protein A